MECTVSATGEKVCESAFDQNGEKNGSMTDNINWEDDMEEEEYDDDAADDDDDFEEDIEDENCKDNHELCSFWSSLDECSKNPNYMLVNCAKSCNSCPKTMVKGFTSEQSSEVDSLLAANAKYGEKQEVGDRDREKTMFVIRKTVDYMQNYVHAENPTHQLSKAIINECRNHDHRCSYWAALGECEANPSYMVTKCAPACLSCHKIDFNNRYAIFCLPFPF
jgi:prolyl 4-hydroxylase